jgi:hypothetical protein
LEKASLVPAVGAGFQLIGRAPLAVLIWGLITVVLSVAPYLVAFPFMGAAMFATGPDDFGPGAMGAFFAAQALLNLLSFVAGIAIVAIVTPAIYRAVMFPEAERRNFYLRLGKAELHMALIYIVLGLFAIIAVVAAILLLAIPFGIVFGVSLSVGEPSAAMAVPMVLLAVLIGVGLFLAFVWVFGRLWMATAMTVAEGRLRLFEGWAFTKGYGWKLVGMNLLVFLIVFGLYLIIALVVVLIIGVLAATAGIAVGADLDPTGGFGAISGAIIALVVIALPLAIAILAAFQAITIAPWASAYKRIAEASGRSIGADVFE